MGILQRIPNAQLDQLDMKTLMEHVKIEEKDHFVYVARHRHPFVCEWGKNKVVFKIGYTSNPEARERSAKTWFPFGGSFRYFEFFDETQARSFERISHREFSEYGIIDKEGGTEWFLAPEEIFKKSLEMLEEGGTPRYSVWEMLARIIRKQWRNSFLYKIIN